MAKMHNVIPHCNLDLNIGNTQFKDRQIAEKAPLFNKLLKYTHISNLQFPNLTNQNLKICTDNNRHILQF